MWLRDIQYLCLLFILKVLVLLNDNTVFSLINLVSCVMALLYLHNDNNNNSSVDLVLEVYYIIIFHVLISIWLALLGLPWGWFKVFGGGSWVGD